MNKLTLNECSKRKLDETYLVVYAIKNEINMKKVIYILLLVLILKDTGNLLIFIKIELIIKDFG